MKANFKREVKRNKNKHKIRRETRENGPLLSRVVDPPGTKGGPRAGNFPGPPKNTFCPGWSHDPGQNILLSRVVDSPGTKGPFVPGGGFTRDKRGASYIFAQPPPSSNMHFPDLRRAAVVSPIAPPAPPPSPSAARAPPPPRPGRLGRRPRQATHR